MSFPLKVKEKALVNSGRCCCLCHKFCGTKMELHHIIQRSEGGEDTDENCLPLCFDCHAEVKAYNPKHPKGIKYTNEELKKHRDRWYKRVTDNSSQLIHPETVELDRELFRKITRLLPVDGSILFVRVHDYGDCWYTDSHKELRDYDFFINSNRSDLEFIDLELEVTKSNLSTIIDTFLRFSASVSSTTSYIGERGRCVIYPEIIMRDTNTELKEAVDKVNRLADKVCVDYDDFIRLCRRKLAIDPSCKRDL